MLTTLVGPGWLVAAFLAGAGLAVMLVAQLLRLDLAEGSFWSQFWPNLVATFSGVVLALWAARWQERAARRAEETSLLRTVRDNLTLNLQVLAGLRLILQKSGVVVTQVDATSVEAIFPRLSQVSTDPGLTTGVAVYRHSLDLLNLRLDVLRDAAQHPQGDVPDVINQIQIAGLSQGIAQFIPGVEKVANELLPRINVRLGLPSTLPAPVASSPPAAAND